MRPAALPPMEMSKKTRGRVEVSVAMLGVCGSAWCVVNCLNGTPYRCGMFELGHAKSQASI